MRGDLLLILGVIVFIFVIWVATGGPSHPISFAGPYITPTAPGVRSTGYGLSRGGSASTSPQARETDLRAAQQDVIDLEKAVVAASRFGEASPYKGAVTLRHSTTGLRATDEDQEYIELDAARIDTPVTITGWYILSNAEGDLFQIRGGTNLPVTGAVNTLAPITLSENQHAIITIGESPNGLSFRENKCTGYFSQFQTFTPSLPNGCPAPADDFNRFYFGEPSSLDACYAYIKSLPRCTVPIHPPSDTSADCRKFIDTYLNYNGCVATHRADPDFWGDTWHLYLGENSEFFTKDHDTIKLLDATGKTVDLFSY